VSGDDARIATGLARTGDGVIDDLTARLLASAWHSGQFSPLDALASTGAIVDGVDSELRQCLGVGHDPQLQALLGYVAAKGSRGPQPGWSRLGEGSA
jgi:hypothetical protein